MAPNRHHNSPRGRRRGAKFSRWLESPPYMDPPIVTFAARAIIILASPVWIPIFIVVLPFRFFQSRRREREAAARQATVVERPVEPPKPVDPELVRRRELARRTNQSKHPRIHCLYDPFMDDPAFAWAIKEAGDRASKEVGHPHVMGTCHLIWRRQKEILKEEFDIDWYSPAEMNPRVIFD